MTTDLMEASTPYRYETGARKSRKMRDLELFTQVSGWQNTTQYHPTESRAKKGGSRSGEVIHAGHRKTARRVVCCGLALVSSGPRRLTEEEEVASIVRLQERISAMMRRGAPLERVENQVIDPCELSSDQKAALWLYAWSFMERGEQRDRAARYLLQREVGLARAFERLTPDGN